MNDPNINSKGKNLEFEWTRTEVGQVEEIAEFYKLKPILASPLIGTTN